MKTQHLSVNRLGTLPLNIIETILCLIPFREAARTCVLSKKWRYNWTKIPKIVFNEDTLQGSTNGNNLFCVVYQILLQHQGPIVEFSICIREDDTCVEVDQIMLYLSRMNTVKKLELGNFSRIPIDVFSMQQLTDLYLHECYDFCLPETFNGLCSVTTLTINNVVMYKKELLHLLSKCPLLKTLDLLQEHDLILGTDDSGLIELFQCLPMIENLTIDLWGIESFGEPKHPRKLRNSLYNLKYLCLYAFKLGGDFEFGMRFLAFVIRASPNLEKIKLSMVTTIRNSGYRNMLGTRSDEDKELDAGEDYSDIQLKNLNELEIQNLDNKKLELEFLKFMLVKSPALKTLRMFLHEHVGEDEELEMLNILCSCARASPMVEIILQRNV